MKAVMNNLEIKSKGWRLWVLVVLVGGLLLSYQLMRLQADENSQLLNEAAAITVDQVMDDVFNRLNLYQYG